jgi:hypothetical protein
MGATPAEQPKSDGDPDFILPHHDIITEANWPEYESKGFEFYRNVRSERREAPAQHGADILMGADRVYTGDAFDEEEGRPLAHMPGTGIYLAPADDDQSSPSTGPASS